MPCTACMTSYSLLRREQACANCGYGFCPNCLKKTWIFPTLSKKPMNVCSSCFAQLSQAEARIRGKTRTPPANGNWWGDDVLPPPSFRNAAPVVHSGAAFSGRGGGGLRDDVQKAEKAVDRHHTNTDELKARLDNLKEDEIQPKKRCLTTQEIEERFAALRGVSVDAIRHPGKMFTESGGRPEESTADLIKRINDERKLEEKWHPDKLLQDRVDRLKDVQVSEEIEEREEPADPGTEAAHPEKQSFGTDLPSTSTRHDDFDIGRELDAVKKVLENCDSSEKPSDPAKNHWKNDEYDLKKIMKDVKKFQEQDKKINRVMSRDSTDESESDEDPVLNEEVQQILREAEQAEEEACRLVRVSQAENPPTPEDPNPGSSPQKKPGLLSRIFKK